MAKIVVGICGSIAAYRSPDLVKALKKQGHEVQCILTRSAADFVTTKTLETFSGLPVLSYNSFDASHFGTDHIATARWADTFIVYGATAHTLARLAHGLADDFLSLQLLAFQGLVLVAPAMNPSMWSHPATQENYQKLKLRFGYKFVGPISGEVACGEKGVGHVAEIPDILNALESPSPALSKKRKNILISAGPMQSEIDPVRFLQNRSSGNMALEVAKASAQAGHAVTVLLGPVEATTEEAFKVFTTHHFTTPASYKKLLLKHFKDCDVFISLAAVLDFEVKKSFKKIARESLAQQKILQLQINPVEDFVALLSAQKKPHQKIIAFSLETGSDQDVRNRAQKKLLTKGADLMIANLASEDSGPFAEKNKMWIIPQKKKSLPLGHASKHDQAKKIVDYLEKSFL